MHGLFRWSSKWWPGVIPLAILWAIAAWTSTAPLEADLAARSRCRAQGYRARQDQDRRSPAATSRSRPMPSRKRAAAARSPSVEAVPGVRLVNDETRLVPEAKPFVWSAERDVVRVTLGGSAPLPASKSRLLEAARAALGGVEVVDRMNLARGAPPRFDAAALLLIDQVGKLKDGKITISDTTVSLSGMARDLGGREAIAAALKNLPEGFSVAANEVKAPPYVFQANKDPVAVTLTLTGYVPDNNVHAAIVAAAGRKFFSEKVVDNLKASVGAAPGFANAVIRALGALSRLSTGTLVVSDREVKLSGDALYDAAAGQIRAGLRQGFPAGLAGQGRYLGQAGGGAGRCHRLSAAVFGIAGQGQDPLRSRPRHHRSGFRRSARSADRDRAALPDRQYRDRRAYRHRRRGWLQPGAVGKARAGGGGLSGEGRPAGGSLHGGRLWQRRSRSRPTIPTRARRRTAASISW